VHGWRKMAADVVHENECFDEIPQKLVKFSQFLRIYNYEKKNPQNSAST